MSLTAAWHADRGVKTDDAGRVVQWMGQDGAQVDTHEQTSPEARPKLVKDEQTGRAALRFDGDDYLAAPRFPVPAAGSVFIVYRDGGNERAGHAALYAWQQANFGMAWGSDAQSFAVRPRLAPGGAKVFTHQGPQGDHGLTLGETHYRDHDDKPDELTLVVNGVAKNVNIDGDLAYVPRVSTTGKPTLGARKVSKDKRVHWVGDLFAVVQYNRRLSPAERRQVRKELAARYGIDLGASTPSPE